MTLYRIDHDFMHHGLVRILNVLAMVLTLLVIAYGLINPPATLFPLSSMVIGSAPQAPAPVSPKAAPGPRAAGDAAPGVAADGSRRCAQDKGIAGDCATP